MSTASEPYVTPEQYLALERRAETKSEYVNGRVYALAGASRAHILITGNVARSLGNQLRGRPCETYVSDMRVKVSPTGLYTYPDVVALCEPPQLEDAYVDTLLNPAVIVEVLSESTERYDRGEKFAHYRRLPSLREYVLVAKDRARVEHYARQGEQWVLTELADLDASCALPTIGCALALRDVYERVDVAPNGSPTGRPEGR